MRIKDKVVVLGLTLLISMNMASVSQAAQISDLDLYGWDSLTNNRKEAFQRGIENIPEEIAKLHKDMGGGVYFVNEILRFNGELDPSLQGIYWHESRDIDLSVVSDWSDDEVTITTAHEFGHFIYFQTYIFWSDESKNQLEKEYEYWNKYYDVCSDTEETFAVLYSMYRGLYGRPMSQGTMKMLNDAEELCKWLYENKIDKFDFGPGMEVPDL